jgi:hypothetical protein
MTVVTIGIIRYRTGMIYRDDHTLSLVYWCIFTLTVCLTVLRLQKREPSAFTYLRAITVGILAGFVSGGLYTLYIVILNNLIDPELPGRLAPLVEHARESQGDSAETLRPMEMSAALRGFLYILVCMGFGFLHSSLAALAAWLLQRRRSRRDMGSQG